MERRDFLNAGLFSLLGGSLLTSFKPDEQPKKRVLRLIHLTDMHIEPGEKVRKAIATMLREIGNLEVQPDLVLNTGDNIMDGLSRNKQNVSEQWQAWQEYFRNNLKHEMHSCIGNHDIWGWGMNDNAVRKDPLYGKAWASAMLNLQELYYSFEKKGWKFICLDSSLYDSKSKGYTARLDEEQLKWLKKELENTSSDTNICIASHIPILSVAVYFDGDNLKKGNWQIPGAWMHTDAKELTDLFNRHPNVKAALSGHVHMIDQIEFQGVSYFCNGSVCGKWWLGKYHGFGPSYAIVDFYEDGSVFCDHRTIDW